MKRYMIILEACHDVTSFFMELSEEQKDLVEKIAQLSEEFSECSCMPTLRIIDTFTSK